MCKKEEFYAYKGLILKILVPEMSDDDFEIWLDRFNPEIDSFINSNGYEISDAVDAFFNDIDNSMNYMFRTNDTEEILSTDFRGYVLSDKSSIVLDSSKMSKDLLEKLGDDVSEPYTIYRVVHNDICDTIEYYLMFILNGDVKVSDMRDLTLD